MSNTKEKGKKREMKTEENDKRLYVWLNDSFHLFFLVLPFSAFLTQTFHTRKKKCDLTLD